MMSYHKDSKMSYMKAPVSQTVEEYITERMDSMRGVKEYMRAWAGSEEQYKYLMETPVVTSDYKKKIDSLIETLKERAEMLTVREYILKYSENPAAAQSILERWLKNGTATEKQLEHVVCDEIMENSAKVLAELVEKSIAVVEEANKPITMRDYFEENGHKALIDIFWHEVCKKDEEKFYETMEMELLNDECYRAADRLISSLGRVQRSAPFYVKIGRWLKR